MKEDEKGKYLYCNECKVYPSSVKEHGMSTIYRVWEDGTYETNDIDYDDDSKTLCGNCGEEVIYKEQSNDDDKKEKAGDR